MIQCYHLLKRGPMVQGTDFRVQSYKKYSFLRYFLVKKYNIWFFEHLSVPLKMRFESSIVRIIKNNCVFFLVFCSLIRTFAPA